MLQFDWVHSGLMHLLVMQLFWGADLPAASRLMRLLFVTKVKLINFPITVFRIFRLTKYSKWKQISAIGDLRCTQYDLCAMNFISFVTAANHVVYWNHFRH